LQPGAFKLCVMNTMRVPKRPRGSVLFILSIRKALQVHFRYTTSKGKLFSSCTAPPRSLNASANGASTSMSGVGTMPVMTRHISAYSAAHTPSDPIA
jgi:hypothetical protein